jgi:outer membrane lipoprotein-sorting protein
MMTLRGLVAMVKAAWRLGMGVVAFWVLSAGAQTNDLVDRWIAAQIPMRTWSADLIQTRAFRTLSQPLVSTGRVWVAVPDRFRWELGQPAQTIALRQPDELLIVYPRLKRAEKYPLRDTQSGPWKDALALLEATFPRSRTSLEAQFQIQSVTESNTVASLSLQPRNAAARKFITGLQIGFRADTFAPLWTSLTFSDGSSMRNDFTNTVFNPPLDDGIFDAKLGADVTVVEPLRK